MTNRHVLNILLAPSSSESQRYEMCVSPFAIGKNHEDCKFAPMKGSSTSAWYTRFASLGSSILCWLRCGNCPIKGIALIVWKCGKKKFKLQSRKIHFNVENAFDAAEWCATSIVKRLCQLVRDQFLMLQLIRVNKCVLISCNCFPRQLQLIYKMRAAFLIYIRQQKHQLVLRTLRIHNVYIFSAFVGSTETELQSWSGSRAAGGTVWNW